LPKYLKACEDIFREIRPDIVHSNLNALSVFPLRAAKKAGVPIRIAHSHSTANPKDISKTVVKDVLRPFSKIYPTHLAACSEHAARWLFGSKTYNNGEVVLLKNAIDLTKFNYRQDLRLKKWASLGLEPDQMVIGQVGRVSFQKNQLFTLDVFKQLLLMKPDAVLMMVGDGELMDQVRRKAEKLGISGSVKYLGIRNDVAELYQIFDVLIFPSMYEGLGMAPVEAQATGLPVVLSTNVPAEACIVPDLVTVLSLSKSIDTWAHALCSAASRGRRNRFSRMQALIEAGYDISESADILHRWYINLVKKSEI
jgi:glycosyltransferase involved in cell wall biosynthesis